MKKGLVVLYSPKSLLNFIWYYCAYGKSISWDAIVTPYGADKNGKYKYEVYKQSKDSRLFDKIKKYNSAINNKSLFTRAFILLKMVINAVVGNRYGYCKKQLNKAFNVDSYDVIVSVLNDEIFTGMIATLGKKKRVVLLEDGTSDYLNRKKHLSVDLIKRKGLVASLVSIIMSKLGYADPTMELYLKPTKKCIKFSSKPEKMQYRCFKSINQLNDMSRIDFPEYQKIIKNTFSFDANDKECDVVFLTAPLKTDFNVSDYDHSKFVSYISKTHPGETVLLKKHARDNVDYVFPDEIRIEIEQANIPAEIIINSLNAKKYYLTFPSSLLMDMPKDKDYEILFLKSAESDKYSLDYFETVTELAFADKNKIKLI